MVLQYAQWYADALEQAIVIHGKQEIVNIDQGSQFTSKVFTDIILSKDIKLSMDGKGRAIDNVFIERFWRSVKHKSIYLNPPSTGIDLHKQCEWYFNCYNNEKRHQGIEN